MLLTDFRHLLEISCRRDDDSTFSLDGFEHHRRSVGSARLFNRIRISITDIYKTRRERTEVIAVQRFRGERHNGDRAAMEVASRGNNFCLMTRYPLDSVGPLARQLERRLDGLRAAVHRQGHF